MEQQQQPAQVQMSPEESRKFLTGMDMMIYNKVREQEQQVGKESVPVQNKHEMEGRTGLVDPSLNQQQTQLPIVRRYDQAANYSAIQQALPPQTAMQNQQILGAIQQTPPQFQNRLRQTGSIFNTQQDFVANRVNLALARRRQDSIYAYA